MLITTFTNTIVTLGLVGLLAMFVGAFVRSNLLALFGLTSVSLFLAGLMVLLQAVR